MGLMNKLNKATDFLFKFGIILIAFAVALIPVVFLLGHETLHQQPWNDSMSQHSARKADIDSAKALEVSNIYLKQKGSISASDVTDTLQLADFVCYTLQSQGQAVVRRNVETKAGKKGKKKGDVNSIEGYKVSRSLQENPPLKSLKKTVAKFIDFETDSLVNKYWVIVVSGHFDSHVADQIENIDAKNEGYKFIIVSPTPVTHRIISEPSSAEQQPAQAQPEAQQAQETTEEPQEAEVSETAEAVEETPEEAPQQQTETPPEPEVVQETKPQKKKKKSKGKKSKGDSDL